MCDHVSYAGATAAAVSLTYRLLPIVSSKFLPIVSSVSLPVHIVSQCVAGLFREVLGVGFSSMNGEALSMKRGFFLCGITLLSAWSSTWLLCRTAFAVHRLFLTCLGVVYFSMVQTLASYAMSLVINKVVKSFPALLPYMSGYSLVKAKTEIETLNHQLQDKEKEMEENENARLQARIEIETLNHQLQDKRMEENENARLQARIEILTKSVSKNENLRLQEKIKKTEELLTNAQNEADKQFEEINTLKKESREMETLLNSKISRLEKQLTKAQNEACEQTEKLQKREEFCQFLAEQDGDRQAEIEKLEEQLKKVQNGEHDLRKDLKECQESAGWLQVEIEKLEEQLTEAQNEARAQPAPKEKVVLEILNLQIDNILQELLRIKVRAWFLNAYACTAASILEGQTDNYRKVYICLESLMKDGVLIKECTELMENIKFYEQGESEYATRTRIFTFPKLKEKINEKVFVPWVRKWILDVKALLKNQVDSSGKSVLAIIGLITSMSEKFPEKSSELKKLCSLTKPLCRHEPEFFTNFEYLLFKGPLSLENILNKSSLSSPPTQLQQIEAEGPR